VNAGNKILSDLKRLFVEWGKYYMLPLSWKRKQWFLFAGFVSLIIISAGFDEPIRYFFFTIHGPAESAVCRFVHWFGTGWANLYLLVGFYTVGLILKREEVRLTGLMILQSYLYSGAITISLKSLVGRWRPGVGHGDLSFTPLVTTPNAHLSFPSGDVAVVFSLAIVMMSLSKNALWKSAWIVLAILTSLSRIYYDAHWFSDVVFSTVNAVVAGMWVVKKGREHIEKKKEQLQ
jgi:membrane-associated phospholipid phosphatase